MIDLRETDFTLISSGATIPEIIIEAPIVVIRVEGVLPENQWHKAGWISQIFDHPALPNLTRGRSRQVYLGLQLLVFEVFPYSLKFERHPWLSSVSLTVWAGG